MDIHNNAYTTRYGYIHDSIIDIDNSMTDIHNYFWISIIRVFIHIWLSITGESCGQEIGFHLIFNQWIQLIRFDKRVSNWKVGMD